METRKLYYEDCHIRSFQAQVMDCQPDAHGYWVELDQTAFYPEGGGQACDLGTLAEVPVRHVREQNGVVIHLCDAPLTPGTQVTGNLLWERRFDQMQQHAGEHILSGILHKQYGYHNVGFHVGADVVTVDFDGPLSQEQLPELERQVNQAVWENRPIRCYYPGREALSSVPYRSKRELPWPVRIVEVTGYDICACCGVHPSFTGEIGLVKLLSCVKFHQGVRLEMVCGGRALELMRRIFEENRQVSQIFSAKPLETGQAALRMQEALAQEKFRANALEKQVFAAVAKNYVNHGDVVHFAQSLAPGQVRELCEAIADQCGGRAAVFSGTDDTGYSVCLIHKGKDVSAIGNAMNRALHGRGGGKPGFFQGSVRATAVQIREFFA